MDCDICKTKTKRDYIQIYYQRWICTVCLIKRAQAIMSQETPTDKETKSG